MKKLLILAAILALCLSLTACGSKILHCDGCGAEVQVAQNSNMEEDWIVFCSECEAEMGPIVTIAD